MSTLNVNEARTPVSVVATIIVVSVVASLFLGWLVYFHAPADVAGTQLLFLPALNALLNGLSAIAVSVGVTAIMKKNINLHRAAMFTAFFFSSLFLACYITNYFLHGESHFHGEGTIRMIYFPLLISHILLSVIALPMILVTFFLALSERFPVHKKLARWTFPIWLYVSVTGVIVHLLFSAYH